jgi:hypothetical protein
VNVATIFDVPTGADQLSPALGEAYQLPVAASVGKIFESPVAASAGKIFEPQIARMIRDLAAVYQPHSTVAVSR